MRRLKLPVLILLFVSNLARGAAPASTQTLVGVTRRTGHYDLYIESLDVDEVADLVEQFHTQATAFFGGKSPADSVLAVTIFATRERFHAALKADGQPEVQAGGYYSPERKKVYLFVQPSAYFTRQLLLHEIAHQFHFLVACENRGPKLGMYTEGIAEFLAMHDWDGKRLTIATIPSISLEDYPAAALTHFIQTLDRGFVRMLDGLVRADRPEAWATVRFLWQEDPMRFREWCDRLDRHEDPVEARRAVYGDEDLAASFEKWLESHQQPWRIATIAWQQRGEWIEGSSPNNTVGIALLKNAPAESFLIQMKPGAAPVLAGIVVNYHGADDYRLLQWSSRESVSLLRRKNGKWTREGSWKVPLLESGPVGFGFHVVKDGLELLVNGKSLITVSADGAVGVHTQQGTSLFRVEW